MIMRPLDIDHANAGPEFKLYGIGELEALPEPAWLIDGVMPQGALAELYGKPGVGKSFLALDWALSIAAGKPWQGRTVSQGHVIYVSAEGGSGLKKRVAAWRAEHPGADVRQIRFLMQPVNILKEDEVEALIVAIRQTGLDPVLVIIDTLARCFGERDENAAKDMNVFVRGMDRIKSAFSDVTVLVIHHSGKDSTRGDRGSTALRGAADIVLELTATKGGRSLVLECEKQKDWERFDKIALSLHVVPLNNGESSCVIVPFKVTPGPLGVEGNGSDAKALKALRTKGLAGATYSEWRDASQLPKSTFKNARGRLVKAGQVQYDKERKRYRVAAVEEGHGQGQGESQPLPLAA